MRRIKQQQAPAAIFAGAVVAAGLLAGVSLVLAGISLAAVRSEAADPVARADVPAAAELIGEGTVSTADDEFGGAVSPDGKSMYFNKSVAPHYLYVLCVSHLLGGKWSQPEVLPFSGRYRDSDPVLSPSGEQLLFVSDRPVDGVDRHNFDIWVAARSAGGWGEPRHLGAPVSSPRNEYFASLAANGNLYLTSERAGSKGLDVYVSRRIDGRYTEPRSLGDNVNAPGAYNEEAFIAPDESFIILGTAGREGYGGSDLYVSYNHDGVWGKPRNLGPLVNTSAREYSPRISPDGKYLYFCSERGLPTEKRDRPLTYDELEQRVHSTLNGLGNIYRIDLETVLRPTRDGFQAPR